MMLKLLRLFCILQVLCGRPTEGTTAIRDFKAQVINLNTIYVSWRRPDYAGTYSEKYIVKAMKNNEVKFHTLYSTEGYLYHLMPSTNYILVVTASVPIGKDDYPTATIQVRTSAKDSTEETLKKEYNANDSSGSNKKNKNSGPFKGNSLSKKNKNAPPKAARALRFRNHFRQKLLRSPFSY
uniref:Fibronectin type-III domain-containing protein n=1 Tax=Schistocephalus solidus TaxID=70667 RepID=A0A0X3PCE8_SCHSO